MNSLILNYLILGIVRVILVICILIPMFIVALIDAVICLGGSNSALANRPFDWAICWEKKYEP